MRIPRKIEERRRQQTRRGITPRQQNIQHIIPQHLRVIRFRRQRLQENIPTIALLALRIPLRLQRHVHVVIHDLVHAAIRLAEFLGVNHPVQALCAGPRGEVILCGGESLGETLGVADGGFFENARCFEGEEEEEALDVEAAAVFGDEVDEVGDVVIQHGEIGDLQEELIINLDKRRAFE
ncbi:uncharacterized protein N7458_005064 [Penicillium daleae]|uniref:Uncharacterized protein n=1 Tax=Penicillium daleae TaxID=63821 RepID=A0AAD6C860_9EURO|nr:uncharacterized protein N7458_005064 [Penicillium daleae]KAJ5454108.1 hypothetical protein N7458_005064 [Penicillium daleae]